MACSDIYVGGSATGRAGPHSGRGARIASRVAAMLVVLGLAIVSGCQSETRPVSESRSGPQAPITNTDACAMRLHDICGSLLFYYAINHHLPARLEELATQPGFQEINNFTCPVSGKPYIYNPNGITTKDPPMRVILYDAAASHSSMRWAVTISENQESGLLVTKVIALPDSFFQMNIKVP